MYILSEKDKNGDEKYFFSVDNSPTPYRNITRVIFCNDGILRKVFLGHVWVGGEGEVKAGWTSRKKHRFLSAFSVRLHGGDFYVSDWFQKQAMYISCIYVGKEIFVWRQNMLITVMISTHCLRKEKCMSGKEKGKKAEWVRHIFILTF